MKKFEVSYSYPLEHPIKIVVEKINLLGLVDWFMQKYGGKAGAENLLVSESIIELPILYQWVGRLFLSSVTNRNSNPESPHDGTVIFLFSKK